MFYLEGVMRRLGIFCHIEDGATEMMHAHDRVFFEEEPTYRGCLRANGDREYIPLHCMKPVPEDPCL